MTTLTLDYIWDGYFDNQVVDQEAAVLIIIIVIPVSPLWKFAD